MTLRSLDKYPTSPFIFITLRHEKYERSSLPQRNVIIERSLKRGGAGYFGKRKSRELSSEKRKLRKIASEKRKLRWHSAAEIQLFPPEISEILTFLQIEIAQNHCILHNYVTQTLFRNSNI